MRDRTGPVNPPIYVRKTGEAMLEFVNFLKIIAYLAQSE
jgi:hypothetical protein